MVQTNHKSTSQTKKQSHVYLQLGVNFVLPLIILTKFSGKDQLGPIKGLVLALSIPVIIELFFAFKHRKFNPMSLFAIGGILVTGAISFLGLSEGWLAIRRSVPYVAMAVGIGATVVLKYPLAQKFLGTIVNFEQVTNAASNKHKKPELTRTLQQATLAVAVLCLCIACATYLLTRQIINAPTNTEIFNSEYAKLRLWSLAIITVPFLLGIMAILIVTFQKIEKLTGIEIDTLLQKRTPEAE